MIGVARNSRKQFRGQSCWYLGRVSHTKMKRKEEGEKLAPSHVSYAVYPFHYTQLAWKFNDSPLFTPSWELKVWLKKKVEAPYWGISEDRGSIFNERTNSYQSSARIQSQWVLEITQQLLAFILKLCSLACFFFYFSKKLTLFYLASCSSSLFAISLWELMTPNQGTYKQVFYTRKIALAPIDSV